MPNQYAMWVHIHTIVSIIFRRYCLKIPWLGIFDTTDNTVVYTMWICIDHHACTRYVIVRTERVVSDHMYSSRVIVRLIATRAKRDKQEAKACARADLPHSIPLCALQSLRSSSFAVDSFSCSLAALASPRLFSCLLFASWACKPTTHKPFKMKPNRL